MADLTTLANVKQHGAITHATDDAWLSRLITAASEFIEGRTSRRFTSATYTEKQLGNGRTFILPMQSPVQTVTSVKVADSTIPACVTATDSGWFLIDNAIRLRGYHFTSGAVVELGYTAGFSAMPADAAQAAIELVLLKYKEGTHLGASSQSMAGQSVSFLPSIVPQSVSAVIDRYKRIRF